MQANYVRNVNSSGNVNYNHYDNEGGVRPFWRKVKQSRRTPNLAPRRQKNKQPFLAQLRLRKDKYKGIYMFDKITDFENLYKAYRKSISGKGYTQSRVKFQAAALDGILRLRQQLIDKSYTVSEYNEFMVFDPKERLIKAGSFKDKIVQHSLCDNVLLPLVSKQFLLDNYAGQIGKGTLFGLNRLKEQMLSAYEKYGMDCWIVKADISKFFYNINHDNLKDIVSYHVDDPNVVWLCEKFIDSTDGVGLPLGNQVSQVFALLYLDGMDKFICGELGIEYYGRYMDDFYLVHHNKQYLKDCLEAITAFVNNLGLSLNNKTQIIPFKNGIKFCGFHTYLASGGKVIRKLKNENKRAAQKKFRRMAKLVVSGKLSKEKFNESYKAWKNHASHGNCFKMLRNMDIMVEEIICGGGEN